MRVLIVEDEYYLAADLAKALVERGVEVVGPVGTVADAIAAIDSTQVDHAVLDMNLRGNMGDEIAKRLDSEGIPYTIATGYSGESLPAQLRDKRRVEKPFRPEVLARMITGTRRAA
jgi:DNA-binding response OmpR family regulator